MNTMKHLWLVLAVVICYSADKSLASARKSPHADYAREYFASHPELRNSSIEEDSQLDVPGLIRKYGYPQETHNVTTSDGYILEMHRIPTGRDNCNTSGDRPVAFLMHGLLSSSADFLVLGPGSALGYALVEAGYDVWLGNARGNYYSRQHKTLNPNSTLNQAFWKFSWDEIGNHDLPAMIDYVLCVTKQEKLHYIGHSQGGTTFLVLNSLRPEYNKKFISFQGLAPVSFFDNNEKSLFKALAPFEAVIEKTAFTIGHAEIFGSRSFIVWFYEAYCNLPILQQFCPFRLESVMGESTNATIVPLLMAHAPAGVSVRQVAHYFQVINNKAFRRYDYHGLTNLREYGTMTPPEYNLSKVNAPVYLHYGMSDQQVNYRDVMKLASKLPNTVGLFKVERETYNHLDFVWAADSIEILYPKVVKCMKQAESNL